MGRIKYIIAYPRHSTLITLSFPLAFIVISEQLIQHHLLCVNPSLPTRAIHNLHPWRTQSKSGAWGISNLNLNDLNDLYPGTAEGVERVEGVE
jgi:hypothetical protein